MTEIAHSFRAMNTDVQLVVVGDAEEAARAATIAVEEMFAETERNLSRFLPDSELSALNRSGGQPFKASPLLLRVVGLALDAARDTDGLFDPTVLGALIAAGYDRSFEHVGSPSPILPTTHAPGRRAAWGDVSVDPDAGTITLLGGVGLDLGGIGKGWTVDRAAEMLRAFGSYAIDAGGDIYVAGTQRDGAPWTIGIENPFDHDRDMAVLALRDRAVATSTVSRRRWQRNGHERHHLIDPRTGLPADTGVVSVTVLADSVAQAETLAKVALLLGPDEGTDLIGNHGAEGMLVLSSGKVETTAGIPKEFVDAH